MYSHKIEVIDNRRTKLTVNTSVATYFFIIKRDYPILALATCYSAILVLTDTYVEGHNIQSMVTQIIDNLAEYEKTTVLDKLTYEYARLTNKIHAELRNKHNASLYNAMTEREERNQAIYIKVINHRLDKLQNERDDLTSKIFAIRNS